MLIQRIIYARITNRCEDKNSLLTFENNTRHFITNSVYITSAYKYYYYGHYYLFYCHYVTMATGC